MNLIDICTQVINYKFSISEEEDYDFGIMKTGLS